ncbi:hypothetical protein P4O66_002884 [Electrophorus voltai]|uniref:Ig-like domain-containing protein n=1 Tax=Electrophorus voltai TaxID=2609070 RepID=A0AAD8YUF9_9TELE|nr:hypothetical protein P4O66_002884 [Electrophorus voltai]
MTSRWKRRRPWPRGAGPRPDSCPGPAAALVPPPEPRPRLPPPPPPPLRPRSTDSSGPAGRTHASDLLQLFNIRYRKCQTQLKTAVDEKELAVVQKPYLRRPATEVPESSLADLQRQKRPGDIIRAPTLKPMRNPVLVEEGRRLTMKCEASGSPPLSYKWYKDGTVLKKSKEVKIKGSKKNSKIQIASARLEDSGNYMCVVENEGGSNNSTSTVHVQSTAVEAYCEAPVSGSMALISVGEQRGPGAGLRGGHGPGRAGPRSKWGCGPGIQGLNGSTGQSEQA